MLCSVENSSLVVILIKFHQHVCLELLWTVFFSFFSLVSGAGYLHISLLIQTGRHFHRRKQYIMNTGLVCEPEALVYYC